MAKHGSNTYGLAQLLIHLSFHQTVLLMVTPAYIDGFHSVAIQAQPRFKKVHSELVEAHTLELINNTWISYTAYLCLAGAQQKV